MPELTSREEKIAAIILKDARQINRLELAQHNDIFRPNSRRKQVELLSTASSLKVMHDKEAITKAALFLITDPEYLSLEAAVLAALDAKLKNNRELKAKYGGALPITMPPDNPAEAARRKFFMGKIVHMKIEDQEKLDSLEKGQRQKDKSHSAYIGRYCKKASITTDQIYVTRALNMSRPVSAEMLAVRQDFELAYNS